ncbi:hypothetical protein MKW98_004415 [Papaver atlanticum]|uniref:Uncharacterized protein n=1 Tax=Papaver atlanticum TaxID=357466 RepID=A0AAD4XHV3_9MAGN|nr:hypothetical protein MKW98_004415 [Papaver atlanticum]
MFLGGLYQHLVVLAYDLRRANDETFTVHSLVPTAFLQVWLWAHFRGCCPRLKELNTVGETVYMDHGRERHLRTPFNHPRMALYERVSSKQEFNFCEALDRIEAFTFCPYNDNACGITSCAFGVNELDYWSHVIGLMIRRLVFTGILSHQLLLRQRSVIGRRLLVTRNWQSFWARETKALKSFCSSPPVRDAASDIIAMHHSGRITIPQETLTAAKLQSRSKGKSEGIVPRGKPISAGTRDQIKGMLSRRRVLGTFGDTSGAGASGVPEPHTPIVDPVSPYPVDYLDGSGWNTPDGCYGETPYHDQDLNFVGKSDENYPPFFLILYYYIYIFVFSLSPLFLFYINTRVGLVY